MRERAALVAGGPIGVLLALVTSFLPAPAGAQEPAGGEFAVNVYITGAQITPAVARLGDGRFLVTWDSVGQDGSGVAIMGRLYDAFGVAQGSEFGINTYTTGNQSRSAAAVDGTDRFVVVWTSGGQDGSSYGIFGRVLNANGSFFSPEFPVNTYTTGVQLTARVAGSSAGGFVVVWNSQGQDGSMDGVFGQCFAFDSTPIGSEFQVNTYTTGYQNHPDVAMNAGRSFVVAWKDEERGRGYAQLYDPSCARVGGEVLTIRGGYPSVGMDAAGNFAVAGTATSDGSSTGINARRFGPDGTPRGDTFQVNTTTANAQQYARVAMEPGGDFVVAWDTYQSPTIDHVTARAFRAGGTPVAGEFVVNQNSVGVLGKAVVAMNDGGDFVVAWNGADGSTTGVKARLYLASDVIFADGFDLGDLAAWSSASTDGGDLSVSVPAALGGTLFGAQALVDDTAGIYVQDDSPSDETRYRARFYFDPNDFDPGTAQGHLRTRIFIGFEEAPIRRLFSVVLKLENGQYSLMGRVRLDDDSQVDTGFVPISNGPHYVELQWRVSNGDNSDGTFRISIDGVASPSLTGLQNSESAVDFVRLGALSVKSGAAGTLYLDEFVSHRRTAIGPVP